MRENLLKIIEKHGVNNQQRKLEEEIFELQEAIIQYELKETVQYEIPFTEMVDAFDKITEEFADVMVILEQIKVYYDLDNYEIIKIMEEKIKRQLKRDEI